MMTGRLSFGRGRTARSKRSTFSLPPVSCKPVIVSIGASGCRLISSSAVFCRSERSSNSHRDSAISAEMTCESIYIPMRSEQSDTVSRHFWLHKTEYRLSQAGLVTADEDVMVQDLETGISLEGVTSYLKKFGLGHDGSITKFMFRFDEKDYSDASRL
ncbi:hypothetical protein LIPSTDRAFT_196993 [Lipomyces starkeyi NRRL Y-11557]|uniref:Uncharacterized protein n=1 Tax=Lipomyces starkeyi NRRL Y-11557 TaxID=675824 RepID=A0A1E3PVG8_LIPST|nr:hypothetical protein LIPSTDRAFT_196993 [Lipomyces starkeyi NRRL Y-11557]